MTTRDPGGAALYRCSICQDSGLVVKDSLGGTTPWPKHLAMVREHLVQYPISSSATLSGLIVPSPCPHHVSEPPQYRPFQVWQFVASPCLFSRDIVDPPPAAEFFVGPRGSPGSRRVFLRRQSDGIRVSPQDLLW